MNTSALKTFAPAVRKQLMEAVTRKLDFAIAAQTPDYLTTFGRARLACMSIWKRSPRAAVKVEFCTVTLSVPPVPWNVSASLISGLCPVNSLWQEFCGDCCAVA